MEPLETVISLNGLGTLADVVIPLDWIAIAKLFLLMNMALNESVVAVENGFRREEIVKLKLIGPTSALACSRISILMVRAASFFDLLDMSVHIGSFYRLLPLVHFSAPPDGIPTCGGSSSSRYVPGPND